MDVSEGNVSHINKRLSLTIFLKRVEHTSRPSTTRLLLLLRTDVDSPPYRVIDGEIFEENVFNETAASARVSLHVDGFDWVVLDNISECHVSNTSLVLIRRDCPNRHPNTHIGN